VERRTKLIGGIAAGVLTLGLGALTLVLVLGGSGEPEVSARVDPPPPAVPSPTPTPDPTPEEPEIPTPPDIDPELLAELPVPGLEPILPEGFPQIGADVGSMREALTGLVAVPVDELTGAFTSIEATEPILALETGTAGFEALYARWLVTDQIGEWVQVLIPIGRGALPDDAEAMNSRAAWVRAQDVELEPEETILVVSLSEYTLTISRPDEEPVVLYVGVGREDRTPTPRGLCQIVGLINTQMGVPGWLTSCQSPTLGSFVGEDFALTAIHPGRGFTPGVGGAVSNGCIRVIHADFNRYLADIPHGTPLLIEP
jgi:hypothetical protein